MAKIKVKVTPKKDNGSGTLLASVPVTVVKAESPSGERLFQTKAEIITHIRRGSRPKTPRPRRSR